MPEGIPQVDFSADAKTPMMLHSFSEPHHAPTNLPITASCPARSLTLHQHRKPTRGVPEASSSLGTKPPTQPNQENLPQSSEVSEMHGLCLLTLGFADSQAP